MNRLNLNKVIRLDLEHVLGPVAVLGDDDIAKIDPAVVRRCVVTPATGYAVAHGRIGSLCGYNVLSEAVIRWHGDGQPVPVPDPFVVATTLAEAQELQGKSAVKMG